MLLQTSAVFAQSFQDLTRGIIQFLPNMLIAFVILFVGWAVGLGLGRIVAQLVRSLKVDHALRNAGLEEMFARAGYRLDSGAFLGALVKWFVIAVFLIAALDVLGLTQVNLFLQQVVLAYLPKVIIAVCILLIAALVAEMAYNIVAGATKVSEVGSPYVMASAAKWAIWVFAILAALNQLDVASVFVQTLFTGAVVAVSLALGLSFGLGGQEAAAHYIGKVRQRFEQKK